MKGRETRRHWRTAIKVPMAITKSRLPSTEASTTTIMRYSELWPPAVAGAGGGTVVLMAPTRDTPPASWNVRTKSCITVRP